MKNEWAELSRRKLLRILMSLRGSDSDKPAQSYLIDRSVAPSESYALCLRGTCTSQAAVTDWPFLLSQEVSNKLADIADSAWWDPLARIDQCRHGTAVQGR